MRNSPARRRIWSITCSFFSMSVTWCFRTCWTCWPRGRKRAKAQRLEPDRLKWNRFAIPLKPW